MGNFGLWRKGTMGSRSLPMARELRLGGHDAWLVVPADTPAEQGKECHWDVPVLNVPNEGGLAATAMRMLRAVLQLRPHVVVCVKPKAYAGLVALLLRPTQVRVVVDTDDWEGTGGWNELTDAPAAIKTFVAWHEHAALRAAEHVIVASRTLQALVARRDVTYLPNATWPGAAGWPKGSRARGRRRLGLGAEPTLLLYSRMFELDAGELVDTVRRVAEAVPELRLVVLGAALHGEDRDLRQQLGERATFVGWVDRASLPDLLAAGDVALVPMKDTLVNRARCSVKLLDLMLAGRPIVASAVGQNREYIRDGKTGRLVDGPAVVADAVVELLRNPTSARRLGAGANRVARVEFAWERRRDSLVSAVLGVRSDS